MPRYLIERVFDDLDDEEMKELGARSKRIGIEDFPEIQWEHSHVVTDDAGDIVSFCVYTAPAATMLRDHAASLGQHQIRHIYEIGGDISPDDFPS
jgi:hypothetical protein